MARYSDEVTFSIYRVLIGLVVFGGMAIIVGASWVRHNNIVGLANAHHGTVVTYQNGLGANYLIVLPNGKIWVDPEHTEPPTNDGHNQPDQGTNLKEPDTPAVQPGGHSVSRGDRVRSLLDSH